MRRYLLNNMRKNGFVQEAVDSEYVYVDAYTGMQACISAYISTYMGPSPNYCAPSHRVRHLWSDQGIKVKIPEVARALQQKVRTQAP